MSPPPADITVRVATTDDALAIATLHVASWRATYQAELPASYLAELDPVARSERWRVAITLPRVGVLVARDRSGLLGFAAYGPTVDHDLDPLTSCQLYNLHVHPDRWSGGVGSLLWEEMVGRLAGEWIELGLWVLPTNARARRFYHRKGLEEDGASSVEELAPGIAFERVRYRRSLARLRKRRPTE